MYNSVHFTINLTQERVFIDRFYRINHTKTYNFHAPTLVTSASHKTTAKMRYSFTKITPFDEETTFRHTFLSSDLQCLPPGDPRILCAKHRSPITGKSSIVFNKSGPMKIYCWRVYHEGGNPLIPTCVTLIHHLIYSLNLD